MRIGTWNLAGKWSDEHRTFLEGLDCDVLLLTEVSDRVDLPGRNVHVGELEMARQRRWAGVWSPHTLTPLPDPHGASAMAEVLGYRFCSSILPWRSCGSREPWVGANTFERTVAAVDAIQETAPAIWGGDWNHALRGREYSGSQAGRSRILEAVDQLGLRAATIEAPHQIDGLLSIDHVAVPASWQVRVENHSALLDASRLSDHDAYIVEVTDFASL